METDGEYRLQVKVGVKKTLRRAGASVRCDEKVPDKGVMIICGKSAMLRWGKAVLYVYQIKVGYPRKSRVPC